MNPYVDSIREALRVIGIKSDEIEAEGDSIEIGRSWLIEFNPKTINLQQIIEIPGTFYRRNGDPGDPPDWDFKDIASINRQASPDHVAEYLITHLAHVLIQEQLQAFGEVRFEEEMHHGTPREPHPDDVP